jgi:hypothetical protein
MLSDASLELPVRRSVNALAVKLPAHLATIISVDAQPKPQLADAGAGWLDAAMDASTIVRPARTRDSERVEALLAAARMRLIDTGTRNRLVHTSRKGKRPSTLAILHPDVDQLFESLVREGATLRFRSDPRMSAPTEDASEEENGQATVPTLSLSADVLQTRVAEETLQKRLIKLHRDRKTLEEEQGVNILYLAIGFLRWHEDENPRSCAKHRWCSCP